MRKGELGESYNIGTGVRKTNIEITELLLSLLGKDASSIERVEDRLGHDLRYALDASKIRALGWTPEYKFEDAVKRTVAWYTENRAWWEPLKSGAYLEYYREQYETRRTGGEAV
jgi:dTDP-glucose 4,6-dehydratase